MSTQIRRSSSTKEEAAISRTSGPRPPTSRSFYFQGNEVALEGVGRCFWMLAEEKCKGAELFLKARKQWGGRAPVGPAGDGPGGVEHRPGSHGGPRGPEKSPNQAPSPSARPGFCGRRRPALRVPGAPLPGGGARQEARQDGRPLDQAVQAGRPQARLGEYLFQRLSCHETRCLQNLVALAGPLCLPQSRDLCQSCCLQPGGNFLTTLKPSPKPWHQMETRKDRFPEVGEKKLDC